MQKITKTFKYACYKDHLTSIDEVIEQMIEIDKELLYSDMENLRSFNTTYKIITQHVKNKLYSGFYDDDELMIKFDAYFSRFYFQALKNYIDKKECVNAWKVCFDECRKSQSWQFVYMALGVNAHVNNDLALALRDIIKSDDFKNDYDKINDVISGSIKEVVQELHEKSVLLEGMEKNFLFMYSIFLNVIIRRWRTDAWKNFDDLRYKYIKPKFLEKNADKVIEEILEVDYLRNFMNKSFSKFEIFHKPTLID